jgi:hypothetical protein
MDRLQRAPYHLNVKDQIKVAVSAKNPLGWSEPQLNCACDALVRSTPDRIIPAPILEHESKDSLTVAYQNCKTEDADTYLMVKVG